MITEEKVKALLADMESDLIERTTSIKESKLGPAVCALSNDFPNHKQAGYILLGVGDDGRLAGMTWTDEALQAIGNVKTNGNVLPQPSLVVSPIFKFPHHLIHLSGMMAGVGFVLTQEEIELLLRKKKFWLKEELLMRKHTT